MKIKVRQIVNAEPAASKIMTTQLSFKLSYRLMRIAKALNSELNTIEEARKALVRTLGKEDEKGNSNVTPENMREFTKQYNAMLDTEIELSIEPIPAAVCEEVKTFTAADLLALEPFLELPANEAPAIAPDDKPEVKE